jgi:hypothetical protein
MAPSLHRHTQRQREADREPPGGGVDCNADKNSEKQQRIAQKPSLGRKQEEEVRILTENQLQDACDHHPMHR